VRFVDRRRHHERRWVFALKRHPGLNSRFNSEKNEITRYGDVNIGIAVRCRMAESAVLRGVNHMG